MVQRPAEWFRIAAVVSLVIGVAMVFVLNAVLHADLALWLHIPATGMVLLIMSGSALLTGIAFAESDARSAASTGGEAH